MTPSAGRTIGRCARAAGLVVLLGLPGACGGATHEAVETEQASVSATTPTATEQPPESTSPASTAAPTTAAPTTTTAAPTTTAPPPPPPTTAAIRPLVSPTTAAPARGGNCHPAYPDDCLPASPDLDCPDIGHPVRVDHAYGDPHRLDADGDGRGCEST